MTDQVVNTPVTDATGSPGTNDAPWYGKVDADTKAYIDAKGFKAIGDVVTSYRNFEKLRGAPAERALNLPEKPDDKAGWDVVYDKLGRPKTSTDYKLPIPPGDDGTFAKTASGWFHEAGLSQKQAEAVAAKWNEHLAGVMSEQGQQSVRDLNTQKETLKNEWGSGHDKNMTVAIGTAKMLGLNAEMVDKLEGALGYDGVFKFLRDVGLKFGEDKFVAGDGKGPGALTQESAKSQISALKADREFMKKYVNGDSAAQKHMTHLHKIAAGVSE